MSKTAMHAKTSFCNAGRRTLAGVRGQVALKKQF